MDEKKLLDALQYDFPLTSRPYAALAQRLGETEEAVLSHSRQLIGERIIRSIRGFFDAARLNHRSTLIAAHIPENQLGQLAQRVSLHPGVSHNYAREHHYNLWFTITIPDSIDLHETVAQLLPGVEDILFLPAFRLFKIDARFAMGGVPEGLEPEPLINSGPHERFEPDGTDRKAIYALSQRLPVVEWAFAELAERFDLAESVLLDRARFYRTQKIMRRFGAALNHRRAGFTANGMTGWVVPVQRVETVGQLFASVPEVSHCYERATYPSWPYNVFTMIHGRTRADVERVVQRMAVMSGIDERAVLYSTVEFKKTAVSYFDPVAPGFSEAGVSDGRFEQK